MGSCPITAASSTGGAAPNAEKTVCPPGSLVIRSIGWQTAPSHFRCPSNIARIGRWRPSLTGFWKLLEAAPDDDVLAERLV